MMTMMMMMMEMESRDSHDHHGLLFPAKAAEEAAAKKAAAEEARAAEAKAPAEAKAKEDEEQAAEERATAEAAAKAKEEAAAAVVPRGDDCDGDSVGVRVTSLAGGLASRCQHHGCTKEVSTCCVGCSVELCWQHGGCGNTEAVTVSRCHEHTASDLGLPCPCSQCAAQCEAKAAEEQGAKKAAVEVGP